MVRGARPRSCVCNQTSLFFALVSRACMSNAMTSVQKNTEHHDFNALCHLNIHFLALLRTHISIEVIYRDNFRLFGTF